jgi:hypothetical protein
MNVAKEMEREKRKTFFIGSSIFKKLIDTETIQFQHGTA